MAKISFLVASLLIGTFQSYPQQLPEILSEKSGERLYALSISYHAQAKYLPALKLIEQYLDAYPGGANRAGALFVSAECHFALKQTIAAAQRYEELRAKYPNSVHEDNALFRLGEIAFAEKRLDPSVGYFRKLLEKFPTSPFCGEAAYWIGEAQFRNGDFREALKYFDISAENYAGHRLTPHALYSVGWMNKLLGDFDRSLTSFLKLVERYPASPLVSSARIGIGESYFHLRDYSKAIEYLTSAKGEIVEPFEAAEAQYLIGESYFNLNDFPNALFAFEPFKQRYAQHRLRRNVDYTRAWIFLNEENYLRAIEIFSDLSGATDELAHLSLFRKGMVLKVIGRKEEALQIFRQCADQQGIYTDNAFYETGLLRFESRDFDEARENFSIVTSRFPESDVYGQAQKMLGETHIALENYADARSAFDAALTHPESPADVVEEAMFLEGWTFVKMGLYEEAGFFLERYVKTYLESDKLDEAYFWLGEASYNTRRYKQAAESYRVVEQSYPKSKYFVRALYGYAWSMYKLGDYPVAARSFERVIERQKSDSELAYDSFLRLGDCYFAMGNFPMAAGVYRSAVRQFPDAPGIEYAHFQLAHSNTNQRLFNRAMDGFEHILVNYPQSPLADDAQFGKAWVYFQADEFMRAIREFRTLIANFPQSELLPRAWYNIGDSYFNMDQLDAAMAAYRVVTDSFPNNQYTENALNGLQSALMLRGRPDEAALVTPRFLEKNPGHPDADRLAFKNAEFYHQRKSYPKAIAELTGFIGAYPSSKIIPEAYFRLGEAYAASGIADEAVSSFTKVSEVFPGSSFAPNALLEIALLHRKEGNTNEALNTLDLLGSRYPVGASSSRANYEKGLIYLEKGEVEVASREFESLASTQRGTNWGDKALIEIGRIMLLSSPASAESVFTEVATRRKDEIGAEAQYMKGEALFVQERFANAVAEFEKVNLYADAAGWKARSMLKTGESYVRLSDKRKARETYRALLKIHRLDEFAREADKKLKALQ